MRISPGEAWSDVALEDIKALNKKTNQHWIDLVNHCETATKPRPDDKWKKKAQSFLEPIDFSQFKEFITRWFPLVDKPRTKEVKARRYAPDANLMINEKHMDILKGLSWCCIFEESDELAKAVNSLAISAYKKVPGIGPRATRVGNACVYTLGEMPGMAGVYQMALLKVRVKFRTALKGIEKALGVAGKRVGMSVDELEEIGVPAYGLNEVGKLSQAMGDFTAELHITSSNSTEIRWIKLDGKEQKSVPKAVKDNFSDELKELKTVAKDIQKMMPAQRQRIDNMFLQQRDWNYADWEKHYLNHPLVGYLSRRLIWKFSDGKKNKLGIWGTDGLVDSAGNDFKKIVPKNTKVALWHPIESELSEALAWREYLESNEIVQPFKQAHREIYILTDAERKTNVYSNRFAAHIIKQHQFNVLAVQRSWNYALQGAWDAPETTARLDLPNWNLWAEFWVDGIGEYGDDTTEAGVFYYLSTDQVRFYTYTGAASGFPWDRAGSNKEAITLEEIPALVLSEVFRDVDMFVGVGSVGNDAEWADGGREGRHREYWNSYSFGDLGATAKTRKEVLSRLLPRLKIADKCEITDKFLVVKGEIRAYKIHLGSGNILMEPNDQYLCIVVSRGKKATDNLFVPFEGDNMMSIILSKAFLLANDKKIKDKTIISQIKIKDV